MRPTDKNFLIVHKVHILYVRNAEHIRKVSFSAIRTFGYLVDIFASLMLLFVGNQFIFFDD